MSRAKLNVSICFHSIHDRHLLQWTDNLTHVVPCHFRLAVHDCSTSPPCVLTHTHQYVHICPHSCLHSHNRLRPFGRLTQALNPLQFELHEHLDLISYVLLVCAPIRSFHISTSPLSLTVRQSLHLYIFNRAPLHLIASQHRPSQPSLVV